MVFDVFNEALNKPVDMVLPPFTCLHDICSYCIAKIMAGKTLEN